MARIVKARGWHYLGRGPIALSERLFNKYDYVKQNRKIFIYYMNYNEITGAEFLINHEERLNYFMPLLSDEVLGLALQY